MHAETQRPTLRAAYSQTVGLQGSPDAAAAVGDRFVDHASLGAAEAEAAVLLRHVRVDQAQLLRLPHNLPRVLKESVVRSESLCQTVPTTSRVKWHIS